MLAAMTTPSLRARLAEPGTLALGWLTSPDPLVAETIARAGYDAVALDLQHGVIDDGDALRLLQVLTLGGVPAVVRVAWNQPHQVMKALDLGAWGVIAPMLESADEVRALVESCRYPPRGRRSYGPTRGAALAGARYAALADDEVVPIAMLETRAAFERIDDLLRVEGLGAVFVGPADLSQALGGPPGSDIDSGPVVEALRHVAERCAAAGVPAGVYARSPAYARRMAALGYRIVAMGSALDLVASGAEAALRAFRSA